MGIRKLFLVALAAVSLNAQTSRGTVSGLITDEQKAAIPAAEVELTSVATNSVRMSQTNESGLYRFDAVDPGEYKITVKAQGFRTFVAQQVTVGAAQAVTRDAQLAIGEVQQVVEVTDAGVQLQTEAPVRGGNVEAQGILNLPYASRNPVDLGLTVAGVTSTKFATPTRTFVVNGTRGRSNNFMIDGTDNNDISVAGQAFQVLNPGSVQEVSVQTTNYDAEFGRAGGGVVNVITRGGTNSLHGTAGFVLDSTRDDAISSSLAQSAQVRARGKNLPGTEQQFDGTLGGPIRKDRTFYHLSYLELRQFSTSSTEMVSPTAAGRATLLSLFPTGRNANADLLQQITAGFDGVFRNFNVPLGNGRPDVEFGRIITPYSQEQRVRQYGFKLNHRLTSRDELAGRFLIDDQLQPKGGETLSFPSFHTSSTQKTLSTSIYHTHVFSPSVTNELRPGYTRFNLDFPLDPANPIGRSLPLIAIAGINTTATSVYGVRSTFPQGRLFNNYVLQDTMSVVKGTHTFRFGGDLMSQRARQAAPFNERGILSYGNSSGAQTFSGLANFLDDFGGVGSASRTFGSPFYYPSLFRQAYFFQDRWRASAGLTLTLGMRYEYFGKPMNVILNPVYSGLFNVDPVTRDSPLFRPNKVDGDYNNFSPNVGLAYSPAFDSGTLGWLFGNRKSVFRMGYGIGYDSYFNNITSNMVAGAPSSVSALSPSQVTGANPRGLAGLSRQLPVTAPALTPFLSQTSVYGDLKNPYYQRWSAGIQRELPSGLMLDMAYVGTKGTRLYATEDGNPLVTQELRGPAPAGVAGLQARLDPLQGARTIRTNGGDSVYHAAQFEVKRRFANGFAFTTAYTFSKVIDNGSEIFSFGNTSNLQNASVPSFFGGLQIDRAIGFFDRTNRLVFTYTYELPWMKEQRGALGKVLGGWQVSGLTTFESGVPYTVTNGQDADGLGGATFDRPNYNPAGRAGVRAVPNATSPTGYLNPDAGNTPIDPREARYIGIANNPGAARTAPGNLGRSTERGPGLKNWDVNVVKSIRLSERFRMEFRSEFFNIWNTPMYGKISVSPFAPPQNSQTIGASVFNSQPGLFLNETAQDGGGRVIRFQLRLHF
ncbi:MAG: carboxypeptidase regulatory-like domain-containing protein [Bryobacteraceae bacterium]|nr:carboxypeptidase regulatory-like domain-containing protein [Bryobacteraceae bacterium]